MGSSQNGLYAENQFLGAEGFCEVVVSPRFKALDTVLCLSTGGLT